MTTATLPDMQSIPQTQATTKPPSLLQLWLSSILAFIYPGSTRVWLRASLWRAWFVAGLNTLLAFLWIFAVLVIYTLWAEAPAVASAGRMQPAQYAAEEKVLVHEITLQWHDLSRVDRIASVVAVICFIGAAYLVPFFMLLPFGARPGSNKACFRHVGRTVLLGSGLVHWWGVVFFVTFFILCGIPRKVGVDPLSLTSPILFVISGLILWHLPMLIHAARREYRTAADQPKSHDPWCDHCGYNLTGLDAAGRCPECGRLVQDSMGPDTRAITAWEKRPSLFNFRAVTQQLFSLVRQPRMLFYAMPTLTGQRAAQRWLSWSLLAIFLLALTIVPALSLVLGGEFGSILFSGSLVMALSWTIFGLMMVGIETAGVATISRMRGHPGGGVPVAAAAKVTCYSAILMLTWVLLGGAQLITYVYLNTGPHSIKALVHNSERGEQIVLAVSLGIAHIGGLIWYELTVYRGIRAVQFANK